ncbi:hypothetical protein PIIN_04474 [Serendipita indica DSM 11827]|uniref:Uncharacterized protein n=1 Tax=Serendipita indica (strain DSM 11827) TaxID=1109443 RepID=G4TGU4_SERID|nr:hypothetical protein PIIN_04474 [Serendipita indica DSM 11827]
MTPLMFIIDSSMPFAGRAVLGFTAMSTSGLSTALIAWLGSTYVTKVRVEDVGVEGAGAGRRVHMTTKTMLLRERVTTVYDPSFLEHAEQYFNKVRLRNQIRVPMAEVEKNGMKLVDGMEETVAETLDEKGNVRGWWEVHWRREGDAGFVGECRGAGKIIRHVLELMTTWSLTLLQCLQCESRLVTGSRSAVSDHITD